MLLSILKQQNPRSSRIAIAAIVPLLSIVAGCPDRQQSSTQPQPTPQIPAPPIYSSPPSPAPKSAPNWLQQGLDTAMGAAVIAQSASSEEDWKMVASSWESAISLLESVPPEHPHQDLARQKIAEYRENLTVARQKANVQAELSQAAEVQVQADRIDRLEETAEVNATSEPAEVLLARHLTKMGAKVYEAYWCSVCEQQQALFGEAAFRQINSIECDPRGRNAQPELCNRAGIQAVPTWEIRGQFYPGGQSLDKLATLSDYRGPRNFQNQ